MYAGMSKSDDAYRRLRHYLIAGYLVMVTCVVTGAFWYLKMEHDEHLQRTLVLGGTLNRALAEHVTGTLSIIDSQLTRTGRLLVERRALERPGTAADVEFLRRSRPEVTFVRSMYAYDAAGRGHSTSLGRDISGLRARDFPHFREILESGTDRRAIAADLGPVTKRNSIQLAHGILGADGRFAGIVGTAIEPSYFGEIYKSLNLGSTDSIVLLRGDGAVLVRVPARTAGPKSVASSQFFRAVATAEGSGNTDLISEFDGIRRLVNFRKIPDWNLIIVNTQSYSAVMQSWERTAWATASFVGGALVIAFVLLWFLLRELTRRRDNERALLQSRMLLNSIVDNSPSGIFARDLSGRFLLSNDSAARMFGMAGKSLIGLSPGDFVSENIAGELLELDRNILASVGSESVECVVTDRSGNVQCVLMATKFALTDGEGRISGVGTVATDITRRKRAEEAVRAGKILLEAALGSMNDAIFISDEKSRFVHFNEAFASFYKFRNKAECGKTLGEFHSILDVFSTSGKLLPLDQWAVPLALRGKSATNAEFVLRRKDTREAWMGSYSFAPILDENGVITGSVVSSRDITERRRMEQALRDSELQLSSVIGSAMDAIITVDSSSRIVVFNRAAEAMFGCSAADAMGQSLDRFIPERFRAGHQAHMEAFATTGTTSRPMGRPGVIVGVRAGGEEFPVEATIAVATAGDKQLFTVMLRDIEGRVAAAEAQRDALVREVHHRIKNNLQGVIGLMRQHHSEHPELRELVESMVSQIGVIAVVHGMHGETVQNEISLCRLVTDIRDSASSLAQAEIAAEGLKGEADSIRIPKEEAVPIALILNELMSNAVKHGRAMDADGGVRVSVSADAGLARVSISNPGEFPSTGFDYATGAGLGTGLNLVKSLMPKRGADLEFVREGNRVSVTLAMRAPAIIDFAQAVTA